MVSKLVLVLALIYCCISLANFQAVGFGKFKLSLAAKTVFVGLLVLLDNFVVTGGIFGNKYVRFSFTYLYSLYGVRTSTLLLCPKFGILIVVCKCANFGRCLPW